MSEPTSTPVSEIDLLKAVLNAPQDLVILALDTQYRYVAFNEAHRHTIKAIWGVDIEVGMNMLEITRSRPDDYAKAKVQFDRALTGEHFVVIDAYGDDKLSRRTYRNAYGPLKSATGEVIGLTCYLSDVTDQVRVQDELDDHRRMLEESVQERDDLVERLRVSVQELSTPIIEVWDDVIALPIVGGVDGARGQQMIERLLGAVTRLGCRFVILDLTGVTVIDTNTADLFIKLAHAVRMLGAECILSGVQPAVAQTLILLQVELGLTTQRNLKQALEYAMAGGADAEYDEPRQIRRARA